MNAANFQVTPSAMKIHACMEGSALKRSVHLSANAMMATRGKDVKVCIT